MKCTMAVWLVAAFASLLLIPLRAKAVEPPTTAAKANVPESNVAETSTGKASTTDSAAAESPVAAPSAPAVGDAILADAETKGTAEKTARDEAVIDMAKLYKGYHGFVRRRGELKAKVAAFDAEIARRRAEIDKLTREATATEDADLRKVREQNLGQKLTAARTYMERARAECMQAEARIYNEVYDEIRAEVARYASEHDIRLVRRAATDATPAKPVAPTVMQAVMERVRGDVVYVAHRKAEDITDQILERLNRAETKLK